MLQRDVLSILANSDPETEKHDNQVQSRHIRKLPKDPLRALTDPFHKWRTIWIHLIASLNSFESKNSFELSTQKRG